MPALLPESRMGADLATAVRRDFFQFFHLRVRLQEKSPEGHELAFSPTAPQFRDRVTVQASVDDAGRFRALTLDIDRSVIDDEDTEPQARDIVKSFLTDASPVAQLDRIAGWIADISQRHEGGGGKIDKGDLSPDELMEFLKQRLDEGKPVTVNMGPPDAFRAPPGQVATPAFEVFTGEREACEIELAGARVGLRNRKVSGRQQLRVTVEAGGAG